MGCMKGLKPGYTTYLAFNHPIIAPKRPFWRICITFIVSKLFVNQYSTEWGALMTHSMEEYKLDSV